jgi:hypothetical protein
MDAVFHTKIGHMTHNFVLVLKWQLGGGADL